MATHQHIAVSSPETTAQNTAFVRAVEKDRRKSEKEIAHLGAILKLVEEEIAEAKSGVGADAATTAQAKAEVKDGSKVVSLKAPTGGNNTEGPSNAAFEKAMGDMTMALQMLQVLLAKYSNNKADSASKISEAQVISSKKALKDIEKKIAEIKKKQAAAKIANIFERIAEAVVGAVLVVVGACLLQPELVVMGVLSGLAATGAFDALAKHVVAPILEACGMSKDAAEMAASIIVCVTIILISVLACNPEIAVEEGAEEGTEMAAMGASKALEVSEDAEETATSTMQTVKNIGSALKNSKVGKAFSAVNKFLGPRGRMFLLSLTQSLSSTSAIQNSYNYGATKAGVSKEEQAKVDQDIGIALAVASVVVTLVTAAGASTASRATSISAKTANLARQFQKAGLIIGTLGQSAASGAQGGITIQQGSLEKDLSKDRASLDLLGILSQMIGEEVQSDQKQQAATVKNQKVGLQSTSQLMNGIEGFANLAVYSSPV